MSGIDREGLSLTPHTIVITGATSGIGRQAALVLGALGHRLLVVGRNPELLDALERDLRARGAPAPTPFRADLSLQSEVRRVAVEIAAAAPVIDVLVNNAGAIFDTRQLTAEGVERTVALNHVAYWLLTRALLPNLCASAEGRIVNTASRAHLRGHLDFTDLQHARRYSGWEAYGASKLANICFTRELARRLSASASSRHVSASALHPGFVSTRFGNANGPLFSAVIRIGKAILAISDERGADTIVWLCTAPGAATRNGGYFAQRKPARLSVEAQDDEVARRLWKVTAELVGEGE